MTQAGVVAVIRARSKDQLVGITQALVDGGVPSIEVTMSTPKAIAGIDRDDSGRGTVRLKTRPETLAVSAPFMALFRHM